MSAKLKITQLRKLVQKRRQAQSGGKWTETDQLNFLQSIKTMRGIGVNRTMSEASIKKGLQTALGNYAFSNDFLDFLVKTMPRKTIEAHFDFMPIGMKRSSTGRGKDQEEEENFPPMSKGQKKVSPQQPKKKQKGKEKVSLSEQLSRSQKKKEDKQKLSVAFWDELGKVTAVDCGVCGEEKCECSGDDEDVFDDDEVFGNPDNLSDDEWLYGGGGGDTKEEEEKKVPLSKQLSRLAITKKKRKGKEKVGTQADRDQERYDDAHAMTILIENELSNKNVDRTRRPTWWRTWTDTYWKTEAHDVGTQTEEDIIKKIGWKIPTSDNPRVIKDVIRSMKSFNTQDMDESDTEQFFTLVGSNVSAINVFKHFVHELHLPITLPDQFYVMALDWIKNYGPKPYGDYPEIHEVSDAAYKSAIINSISLGPISTIMSYLVHEEDDQRISMQTIIDLLYDDAFTGQAPRYTHMIDEMEDFGPSLKLNIIKRYRQKQLKTQIEQIIHTFRQVNVDPFLNNQYKEYINTSPRPPEIRYRVPLDLLALIRAVTAMSKGRTLGLRTRLQQHAFNAILVGGAKRLTDVYPGPNIYHQSIIDKRTIYPNIYWKMTGARSITTKFPTGTVGVYETIEDTGYITLGYPVWFDRTMWEFAVKVVSIAVDKSSSMTVLSNNLYSNAADEDYANIFPSFPQGFTPFQTMMAVYVTMALHKWDVDSPRDPRINTEKYWEELLGSPVSMWVAFHAFVMQTVQYTAQGIPQNIPQDDLQGSSQGY